ncbi:MAG: glycine betaine ABC transporter substrate-binding protein [Pseudomonadota bacterium]
MEEISHANAAPPRAEQPPRRQSHVRGISLAFVSFLVGAIGIFANLTELGWDKYVPGIFLIGNDGPFVEPITELNIGAKNHLEANVLAQMMAEVIRDRAPDLTVNTHHYQGESEDVWDQVFEKKLDIVPDYSATIGQLYLEMGGDSFKFGEDNEPELLNDLLTMKAIKEQQDTHLHVLGHFGFENSWVLLMMPKTAADLGITGKSGKLSEFLGSDALNDFTIGGTTEFYGRDDGLNLITSRYRFDFGTKIVLDNNVQKYAALEAGKVDIINGLLTDAQTQSGRYVVLEDDLGFWTTYRPLPVIRSDILEARADVRDALEELVGQLTADEMRDLFSELVAAGVTRDTITNGPDRNFEKIVQSFLCRQDLMDRCRKPV